MYGKLWAVVCVFLIILVACKHRKKVSLSGQEPVDVADFIEAFEPLNLPYQITDTDGELTGFDYDNPTADPIDGTLLSNTLVVNGTTIPPGTKITSLKK